MPRRIFPAIGEMPIAEVRKSDVLTILDAVKSEGKLRTANVLLADLKQMMRFAVMRDTIPHSPLESVTKRDAGGTEAGRERVLSTQDITSLAKYLPAARLNNRSELAIWLVLATGCRIGELMGAEWPHVDLGAATWHLPKTKNQRPHTIHLSEFALRQFRALDELHVLDPATNKPVPWVFPNTAGTGPVCIKSFGKQLADRQRPADRRLQHRSKATEALTLPGGKWTAHDLRHTAATLMAGLGASGDVIDECLNHVIESRVRRTYIRDRRRTTGAGPRVRGPRRTAWRAGAGRSGKQQCRAHARTCRVMPLARDDLSESSAAPLPLARASAGRSTTLKAFRVSTATKASAVAPACEVRAQMAKPASTIGVDLRPSPG